MNASKELTRPLSGATLDELIAEILRRCPVALIACIRVEPERGTWTAKYDSKGPWELLKYLHAKNEMRLETEAQAEATLLRRGAEQRLMPGPGGADGMITIGDGDGGN